MNRWVKGAITGFTVFTLALPTVGNLRAPEAVAAAVQPTFQNQVVKLNNSAQLSIKDASFMMQEKGHVLAFRVNITNKSAKELDLLDYWIRVKSKSGKSFKITLSEDDASKKTVPANSTLMLTYFAVVDNGTKMSDLQFDVNVVDFSASGYQRKLGTIKAPSSEPPAVAAYQGGTMTLNNSPLRGAVKSQFVTEDDENVYYTYNFLFENTGYRAISLSKVKLFVQTNGSYIYNTTSSVADLTLQPQERKIITVQATVPLSVAKQSKKLIVAVDDQTNHVQLPIGSFVLPEPSKTVGTTYTNTDYTAKLETLQRVPSTIESDILSADIVVSNPTSTTKQVPNLTGYFVVNGVKVAGDSTVIKLDQAVTIQPQGTYNFVVYTKIPYSTATDKVQFVLTDIQDNKPGQVLFSFTGSEKTDIPIQAQIQQYNITNPGKKAAAKIINTGIFEGSDSSKFYVEVEETNLESRTSTLASIGGYLKDKEGIVVPVSFKSNEKKISPNGTILLRGQGEIPEGFDLTNYKFYMGQAVNIASATKDGNAATEENLIVKPIAYQVKPTLALNDTLDKITIGNYQLSLSQLNAGVRIRDTFIYEGVNLEFKYALKKTKDYENVPGDQKIYLELVEQGPNKVAYGKALSLKPTQDTIQVLAEGAGAYTTVSYEDPDMSKKVQQFNTYVLNVYAMVGDAKVLVASKELKWFYVNQ